MLVLLVICITLALSYAMVRSQFTGLKIQGNAHRQVSARQAAVTGLTMAIKSMHSGTWDGVDSTLSGTLGGGAGFQVTYTAGDPSLAPGHADYQDSPYRVTLVSTGSAADPDNPAAVATYQIRAVLRLVPRALGDEPSDWSKMQGYTVYQSKKYPFEVDVPCRLEGKVRIQGKLKIAPHYPNDLEAWRRYLEDLKDMRAAGRPDYRPFNGPVDLAFSEQEWWYYYALTSRLGVTAVDVPVDEAAADWVKPTALASYQIYDGGPTYTIPAVGATLKETTLEADPLTNPLGIYYRDGTAEIKDNVTIRGTLFCRDDIKIKGTNVRFEPVGLPALHGSEAGVRLPAATCRSFAVESTAGGALTGLLAVFEKFEIEKSPETVAFAIQGRVVAREFYVKERQPWETLNWETYYGDFEEQLDEDGDFEEQLDEGGEPHFPVWMGTRGRDPKPLLTVKPDSGSIRYHWHYPGNRIYVPHPDDDGLRWDLWEWTENP